MSRGVSSIINGIISTIIMPLSPRQKNKTKARIIQKLEREGIKTVKTLRGDAQFYSTRGAGTASSIERYQQDEPETLQWIDKWIKPGQVLWDIGAHVGCYSIYAGLKQDIKVIAFEPSALNFGLLVEHIALNNMGDNVHPFCIALSDKTHIDQLHMSAFETGQACNSIGSSRNQFGDFKPTFSQAIPAFSAEDFCKVFNLPAPNHIKIDVDGNEESILLGAKNILPNISSLMIEIEGHNAENNSNILMLLNNAGLVEDTSIREHGHKRNRLYLNKRKL